MSSAPAPENSPLATACASGSYQALEAARAEARAAKDRCALLEAHLRRILDAIHDAYIVVDATGAILQWNRAAERLLGWPEAEVVGRQLVLLPPASGEDPLSDVTQVLAGEGSDSLRHMEAPVRDRWGQVFQVELNVWSTDAGSGPRHHAFLRKLDTGAGNVHVEQCKVGSIVASSDAAIVGEDLDGRIITWNRAAREMYGYEAAEVLGKPGCSLIHPGRRAEGRHFADDARQGRHVPGYETVHVRSDGSSLDVAVTISAVHDVSGTVTGISTIVRDITEQRRMAAALEAALDEARSSEASSRRFLADAAHQLRTPIAGIRACADTLARSSSLAEGQAVLTHMIEETSRAGRLIGGMLRMARLDRGEAPMPVPCDLVEVCASEVERVRMQAPQLESEVRVVDGLSADLRLDPQVVSEILGNLLDNARRHASQRIDVVVGHPDPHTVELRVVDDGPGLAPEMTERVFERFVSLDGRGGSGLGLPIARGLAHAHGGDLVYEDHAFVLRLPSSDPHCDSAGGGLSGDV